MATSLPLFPAFLPLAGPPPPLQVNLSAPLFSVAPFLISVLSSGFENLTVRQTPLAESRGESVKNQSPGSPVDLLNQNLWFRAQKSSFLDNS